MSEIAPVIQPEEPIWSTVRNNETPEAGLTITVFGQFRDGHYDSETGQIAEFGNWPLPEVEAEIEEKAKRRIRLRNQAPPPGPKP